MKRNNSQFIIFLFALSVISVLISGCTDTSTSQSIQAEEEVTTVIITDALGREVQMPDETS